MANDEDLDRLRQGIIVWNRWREQNPEAHVDLSWANLAGENLAGGANLTGANLNWANLHRADLLGAELGTANLHRADLRRAELGAAELGAANLTEANLREANLREANLRGACLSNANLRQATLIDSRLDGANLTGAKLWETQRDGWSIKGVICQRALWDRDGKKPTEYGVGDFERIFAEKPRIVLRYPGGVSPVDLAMLPLIVERLQAKHPSCALHIRSVQDDGSGAVVTITVDDRTGRPAETVRSEVETLRCEFINFQQQQQQLNQEVRQQIEARFTDMTKLFEMSPRQINVGHLTGHITVEGNAMSRDTYNIPGQAGVVGPKAHAPNMTFQQVSSESGLDLPRLAQELARLRAAMEQATESTAEQDEAIGAVAAAEEAAALGDGPTVLQRLKAAGEWTLGFAEKTGAAVAAKAIGIAMGMP
jgi:hypothetical protein